MVSKRVLWNVTVKWDKAKASFLGKLGEIEAILNSPFDKSKIWEAISDVEKQIEQKLSERR